MSSTVLKDLRESGLLFISTVAAHGDALGGGGASSRSSRRGGKKTKSASAAVSDVVDSEFFPPMSSGQQKQQSRDVAEPPPLRAPAVSSIVELASALADRNRESALDAGELARHLPSTLDGGASSFGDEGVGVVWYLVAWAAQLGWRNPSAAARLLECLLWAKSAMR